MQAEEVENYASLPLEDRLTHKLWKARLEAYEELAKMFQRADGPKDPVFRTYWETIRAAPNESNAAALESSLACLLAFMRGNPEGANKLRPMMLSSLIEKCLSSVRTGVKSRCLEALLLFVELDTFEPVLQELGMFMGHKQPKLIAACVAAMTEIIKEFGADSAAVKTVVKVIPTVFQHADKNVRGEASGLVLELYKWIGPAISPFLEALKPIQVKELNEQFAKTATGGCRPNRFLRSQQHAIPLATVAPSQVDGVVEEVTMEPVSSAVDAFDLADPVNVLDKIPASFEEMVESSKWKDRKDALDELNGLLKVPRIEDGMYGSLVQTLSKRLGDANILVVISAAGCIESMAKGLRRSFSMAKVEALPALLERCKEKKQNVLDALRSALDSLSKHSLPPVFELAEGLAGFVAHKNPQVKAECLSWMARGITRSASGKKEVKGLLAFVTPVLEDGSLEVREAAMKLVATLLSVCGSDMVMPFLDGVEKGKLAKIQEQSAKLNTDLKAPSKTSAPSAPPVPSALPGKQRLAPPSTPSKGPRPVENGVGTPAGVRIQPTSKQARRETGPVQFKHSDDAAMGVFEGFLPASIFVGLGDGNWKTRLESLDSLMSSYASGLPDLVDSELLVRFIGQRPGWKESNFQVYQRMFQLLKKHLQIKGADREATSLVSPWAFEKLADMKIGGDAVETLLCCADAVGLPFIIEQGAASMKVLKSPKNIAEILKWSKTAMGLYGVAGLATVDLVEAIKAQITSSNPMVRSSAISLAACLRQYFGPDTRAYFADIPGPILASLDAEFEKTGREVPPKPSRPANVGAPTVAMATPAVEAVSEDVASLDSAACMELTIPAETIAMLGDAKWQTRKEALDQVAALIEKANGRVKLTNPTDLFLEIKSRFSDSNKNLTIQALDLTGALALACGPAFEKHLKIVLAGVIGTLTDNKLQVRQSALKSLDSMKQACRLGPFLPIICQSMSSDSPNLRKEILLWTAGVLKGSSEVTKEDMLPLLSICLACLQDRTMEVRKAAQTLISQALPLVPPEQVKRMCQEQKPAMISVVQGLLDVYVASAPSPVEVPSVGRAVGSGLFLPCKAEDKILRSEKERGGIKWIVEAVKQENIDILRDQMAGHLHGPLVASLFSLDFKEQINGLGQLETAIAQAKPAEKELCLWNLDLLLKYVTLKFYDNNTSVLLKSLDFLEKLLALVDEANSRLTEHEAACFIPHFIGKAGETTSSLRTRTRGLFRQLCRIYPASKLFGFLLEGLKSKVNKNRIICLEEMQSLLARNGLVVLNPSKHVPIIAGLIADKDAAARSAALDVMVRLVGLMGDQVSKYLTELSPKELDLLEERLKHRPADIAMEEKNDDLLDIEDNHTSSAPVEPAPTARAAGPFALDLDKIEGGRSGRLSVSVATPPAGSRKLAEATPPNPFAAKTAFYSEDPLERLVHQIRTSSDMTCIQALQRLDEYLTPSISTRLEPVFENLITALCIRLHDCCTPQPADTDKTLKSRLGRYVTNALVIAVNDSVLLGKISQDALIILLSETLHSLTSPQLAQYEDQEQLSRALNILLVKSLENAQRNSCYMALLVLLEQAFRVPPESGDAKYPEFVMKCLWKMTKQLAGHLEAEQIRMDELLRDIHSFFCALPPLEWKSRAAQRLAFEDLPLRTVKTILHELVVAKGSEVFGSLGLITSAETSFVTAYLKTMLQAAGLEVPSVLPAVAAPPAESNRELTWAEMEPTVKEMCLQICSKPNTRSGLTELWDFQQAHSYAEHQIDSYLQQLGSFFYKYIRRNLAQIDMEQRMKKDSTGADMDGYKSRLTQMQAAMAEGGMVTSAADDLFDGTTSPVRSRLDSPLLKMPNSPVVLKPMMHPALKDSSIVNLKERLARLRTNTGASHTSSSNAQQQQ